MAKFVLAYSGGLDTSVILKWLQVTYGADVITVTADLGQKRELVGVQAKALACGATKAYLEDLREEFTEQYVWPTLKAGALYQGVYPMATAIGRPLIAKRLVEIAREVGADAVVHGCTGTGNDQVRFEVSIAALAPELECVAPLRTWDILSRDAEIAWAHEHNVPVAATRASPYSIDENLWGMSIEAGPLEDPWAEPPAGCWQITVDPDDAPREPAEVTIGFDQGVPVSLDGKGYPAVELVHRVSELAAGHGVGRIDMVEDRLVGIKSREVYEAPAAVTFHAARLALEQLTLDRETRRALASIGQELATLIYDGLWFTPLREAIDAFVRQATKPMTGEVRLRLHRGRVIPVGRRSPNALYEASLATYGSGDAFNHESARGFIDIYGLGARIANAKRRGGATKPDPESQAVCV